MNSFYDIESSDFVSPCMHELNLITHKDTFKKMHDKVELKDKFTLVQSIF